RIENAAGGTSELGVVLSGQNFELLNRFDCRSHLCPTERTGERIVVPATVDAKRVVRLMLSIDIKRVRAFRTCLRIGNYARNESCEQHEVTVLRRQVEKVFRCERVADITAGDVDEVRACADSN